MTSTFTANEPANLNTVMHGDCVEVMRGMKSASIDFVITDPPYITRYCARDGRSVANDDNARWLKPAFAQMHRLLKSAAFCISFYGWNKADLFYRRMAQRRFPHRRTPRFPQEISLIHALPPLSPRTGLFAHQGRAAAARAAGPRCAGVSIHRQQAALHAKAGRRPQAAD